MTLMWKRMRALRDDEHGGVLLVMAYAVIAVAVMAGLAGIAITSGMTSISHRASQAAEAGLRGTVGSVLAEVNAGAGVKAVVDTLPGRQFANTDEGPVKVATTVDSARYDGSTVHLDITIKSTGRLDWTRKGTATLTLAYATSLARIVDGRAVWDFAAQSEQNDYSDRVVALWTAGEMAIYDPSSGSDRPSIPNAPTITKALNAGVATFTAAAAGGCGAGETVQLDTRFRVGSERWSAWSASTTASGELATGLQATMEARVACMRGSEKSAWVISAASILRSTATPTAPAVTFDIDVAGNATVYATAGAASTAGVTVTEQVRIRIDGGTWSSWMASGAATVPLRDGQTLEAQGRVRVTTATSDSGWVESGVTSQTYTR